jgi:hypothetical protein
MIASAAFACSKKTALPDAAIGGLDAAGDAAALQEDAQPPDRGVAAPDAEAPDLGEAMDAEPLDAIEEVDAGFDAGLGDTGLPPDGGGACVPGAKRIFVTNLTFTGDLKTEGMGTDGLSGADNLCNQAAMGASLGGTWVAWMSSTSTHAIDRVRDVGPWYLVDQCTRIFTNKSAITNLGPAARIDMNENGVRPAPRNVWTGTNASGRADNFNCNNWTNNQPTGGYEGTVGAPTSTNEFWTRIASNPCSFRLRLYCFEQ